MENMNSVKKWKQNEDPESIRRISEAEEHTTVLSQSKVDRSTKSSRHFSPGKETEKNQIKVSNLTNESYRKRGP